MIIGVLDLQGAVHEHISIIESCNDIAVRVKENKDLENLDGLIIPGGESTVLSRLLKIKGLNSGIVKKYRQGLKIWGTCAGLIILAKKIEGESMETLGLLDIEVKRNGYGRQLDSFTKDVEFNNNVSTVRFIRAPRIIKTGVEITPLLKIDNEIVAARTKNTMFTTFHPEVTGDTSFYNYFKESIIKTQVL